MTVKECAIVSAYTGIFMGGFPAFHKYVEKLLDRPVWTHELANKETTLLIKKLSKLDFIGLGESATQN